MGSAAPSHRVPEMGDLWDRDFVERDCSDRQLFTILTTIGRHLQNVPDAFETNTIETRVTKITYNNI